MIFNLLNKDLNDKQPIDLTEKEFWILFLTIRNTVQERLTKKEIEIVAEHLSGTQPEKPKGNYKTYLNKIKEKGVSLSRKQLPNKLTLQINAAITKDLG